MAGGYYVARPRKRVPLRRKSAWHDSLVIVESPAKAKTINKFLGKGFVVKASMGHVRDLPKKTLGVDEKSFEPTYVSSAREEEDADRATEGREGGRTRSSSPPTPIARARRSAGICKKSCRRTPTRTSSSVMFNEITKKAILAAFEHPREDRRAQGRRPAGAAHPRPIRRLQDQPAALGQGAARLVGGTRSKRRAPDHRRARARDPGVRPK